MEIIILIGLILVNGLFAMSEIALLTARKVRLAKLSIEGNRGASSALKLSEDPTRFLSTIQIGITSIGIMSGIVGEAALATPLSQALQAFGLSVILAEASATILVVIIVTYIAIVLGELVPKRLGQISPESIACWVSRPTQLLATIVHPFVVILSLSTQALLKLIGIRQNVRTPITEEEIHTILDEGLLTGAIETQEHQMARNALRLDDRPIISLMTPRYEVVFLDIQLSSEENLARLIESKHSIFPVCNGELDQVLGVVHAKEILTQVAKSQVFDCCKNLGTSLYVLGSITGIELLEQFRTNQTQMAFIVDEYSQIQGIVTLQDILGAVAGALNIPAEDTQAIQREDGSWLLDGSISLLEMRDCLKLRSLPEGSNRYFHTLSGMLMLLMGDVPITGHHVNWEGWHFEIVDMDSHRIDKVLATPIQEEV